MTLDPGTCKKSTLGEVGLAKSVTFNPFSPLEAGVGMDSIGLAAWKTSACTGGYVAPVQQQTYKFGE